MIQGLIDIDTFVNALADILRLPDETVAMSYVYLNRYKHFLYSSDIYDPLDSYTLALATISLSAKVTESPRRLSEIILPAHRLLHTTRIRRSDAEEQVEQAAPELTVPSETYNTLRATLVRAELILLRALKFELRIPLPLAYIERYLDRALNDACDGWSAEFDKRGKESKEEYGVMELMETGLGRACRDKAVEMCKNNRLANLYPARAVAVACLYLVMKERRWNLQAAEDISTRDWMKQVTSGKVDEGDFLEALEEIEGSKEI